MLPFELCVFYLIKQLENFNDSFLSPSKINRSLQMDNFCCCYKKSSNFASKKHWLPNCSDAELSVDILPHNKQCKKLTAKLLFLCCKTFVYWKSLFRFLIFEWENTNSKRVISSTSDLSFRCADNCLVVQKRFSFSCGFLSEI